MKPQPKTNSSPILNGPYTEPEYHYATVDDGSLDYERPLPGRRIVAPNTPQVPLGRKPQGNFTPPQVFFCGGDKGEFDKFKRGLSNLATASVKKNAERMLKIELDDEAFDRVYGFRSHPVADEKGRVLAVRVISQFGEESTKLVAL